MFSTHWRNSSGSSGSMNRFTTTQAASISQRADDRLVVVLQHGPHHAVALAL